MLTGWLLGVLTLSMSFFISLMVVKAMGKRTRLFYVPLWLFGFAIAVIRFIPRYKRWSSAMAQRMCQDLVFDHTEARKFLGFKPRRFTLSPQDLPK